MLNLLGEGTLCLGTVFHGSPPHRDWLWIVSQMVHASRDPLEGIVL